MAAREGIGANRLWPAGGGALSRPLGRTEWRQDTPWGLQKVRTGKGMGVETPGKDTQCNRLAWTANLQTHGSREAQLAPGVGEKQTAYL